MYADPIDQTTSIPLSSAKLRFLRSKRKSQMPMDGISMRGYGDSAGMMRHETPFWDNRS